MVKNIGTDIIEVARIKSAWERHGQRFLDKIFTQKEQEYCLSKKAYPERHFAGRFAAKEALAKALGTGIGVVSWTDLEILNDESGKPVVVLSEELNASLSNPTLMISISHCHAYATATAIFI